MALANGNRRWALPTLLILALIPVARACYFMGAAVCDTCWDGADSKDEPIASSEITVNCTIVSTTKSPNPLFVWAAGKTATDGTFQLPLTGTSTSGNVDAVFLDWLFVNANPTKGVRPTAYVAGCYVQIASATCPIRTAGNACAIGASLTNGFIGGGNMALTQLTGSTADLQINGGVCYAPSAKKATCPTTPGGKGDPHFTGADGSHFDFSGEPNSTFSLISDAHLHVNVFYGGRYGQWGDNPHKALTWIRKMGVLWGHHTIALEAREGARWQYDTGYMARMEIDGEEVRLEKAGDSVKLAGGDIELRWVAAKERSADDFVDVYDLTVGNVLKMRLTLRPEIAMLRTESDGVVHFDFEVVAVDVSENAHGILGQTFRNDHRDRLKGQQLTYNELLRTEVVPGDNAEGFLDGVISDYRTSGLLRADCQFNRFTRAAARDAETAQAIELTSSTIVVGGDDQTVATTRLWRKRLF